MAEQLKTIWNENRVNVCMIVFGSGLLMAALYLFSGQWPWVTNPYNSYTLQTCSWLDGRMDLGQDYPFLELAIYQGKYYVSFPPFPSFVMLPFAAFFKTNTPDGWIAFVVLMLGVIYTYKVYVLYRGTKVGAFFWTFFLSFGTNLVFIRMNGWVWFIAQSMCFTLSVMALYYAKKGEIAASLAFWACSVGCRPLQVIYFPVLILIIWKTINKNGVNLPYRDCLKKIVKASVPMIIIAIIYMALNYIRFGNIMEFGHNYLPEFVRSEEGQFSISYIKENMTRFFRMPGFWEDGAFHFYTADGFAFWLVSPIYLSYLIYFVRSMVIKDRFHRKEILFQVSIIASITIHFILLMSHKTLGGWQFGNRYTNDALPYLFMGLTCILPKEEKQSMILKLQYSLCLFGMAFNMIGTVAVYNYWI